MKLSIILFNNYKIFYRKKFVQIKKYLRRNEVSFFLSSISYTYVKDQLNEPTHLKFTNVGVSLITIKVDHAVTSVRI